MTWAHHRGRSGRRARAEERGETLIELVATIAIMGFGMIAVIASIFTASVSATNARERTQVSLLLQRWADQNIAPKGPTGGNNFQDCNAVLYTSPASLPPGYTATFTAEYLISDISSGGPASWNTLTWGDQAACAPGRDGRLQRITFRITTKPGRSQITDSLTVVKRNPNCPSTFNNADLGPC